MSLKQWSFKWLPVIIIFPIGILYLLIRTIIWCHINARYGRYIGFWDYRCDVLD